MVKRVAIGVGVTLLVLVVVFWVLVTPETGRSASEACERYTLKRPTTGWIRGEGFMVIESCPNAERKLNSRLIFFF